MLCCLIHCHLIEIQRWCILVTDTDGLQGTLTYCCSAHILQGQAGVPHIVRLRIYKHYLLLILLILIPGFSLQHILLCVLLSTEALFCKPNNVNASLYFLFYHFLSQTEQVKQILCELPNSEPRVWWITSFFLTQNNSCCDFTHFTHVRVLF